jgi:glycosidase
MPTSLLAEDFQSVLDEVRDDGSGRIRLTPSPVDWRDQWIYFLILDRFNNRLRPPKDKFDSPKFVNFQGGTFRGVKEQLPYLKELGVGAIWLSPAFRNMACETGTYHGYGIHDFLRAEPRFAEDPNRADDELRELVDEAHQKGLFVIFDIVLNHIGNAFLYDCDPDDGHCRSNGGAEASFHSSPQPVLWRDPDGSPRNGTIPIERIAAPSRDAFVWPKELQRNEFFRRQGLPGADDDTVGDFASLKQTRTDNRDLQRFLIRSYQYVIARFDVDGFRIDTLKYLKGDLARTFGNAIREFALAVGKKNFFTFGEVFDNDEKIAQFIGRSTRDRNDDSVGVDAALDFPLRFTLPPVVKGLSSPSTVSGMYQHRKDVEQEILSSHGDATRFFVTFLDNHDVKERIRFVDPSDEHRFDAQVTLGLACLFGLQGIPCVYYGTEQGLHGRGTDEAVREALWGGPGFDRTNSFYRAIKDIANVRKAQPALRYGRQYFRPISGDGQHFGVSGFPGGVLSFSRILNDQEVIVVANTNANDGQSVHLIIDQQVSQAGEVYRILYSNQSLPAPPGRVMSRPAGSVEVLEVDGSFGTGPTNTLMVTLAPLEAQILGK